MLTADMNTSPDEYKSVPEFIHRPRVLHVYILPERFLVLYPRQYPGCHHIITVTQGLILLPEIISAQLIFLRTFDWR